jgi:hypothetical protein
MSTAYSGVDGKAAFASIDVDVTGFTADVEDGGFDATTTADAGWEDMLDSTRKVSGSCDLFFNRAKNPFASPLLLFSRPSVYPTLRLDCGGTKYLEGMAKITKVSFKSAVKEGITMTISYTSRGAWTLPAGT